MKIKKGFILRKVSSEYMVVAMGEAGEKFNGMIRMNDTGAFIWNIIKEGASQEEIITKMCENYEDLNRETAENDLNEFLKSIEVALEK